MVFPGYCKVFSSLVGKTSLKIFKTYKNPEMILSASKDDVVKLIASTYKMGMKYALEKYGKLIEAANLTKYYGKHLESIFDLIQMDIEFIELYITKIESILESISDYTLKYENHEFIKQIHLLDSIRTKSNGQAVNPVLKDYYDKKKLSKPKMVAIGAIMHKLSNIIFAVLRDNKPFILKTPEDHCNSYGPMKSQAT